MLEFRIGLELDKTPAHGQKTLFVHGLQSVDHVVAHLDGASHIAFGVSGTFDPKSNEEWDAWGEMITFFLERDYLCSLDIPMSAVPTFNECGLNEYFNFIPKLCVNIPYIKLWNYNTVVKLDDESGRRTNQGTWTHELHKLMSRETFTDARSLDE